MHSRPTINISSISTRINVQLVREAISPTSLYANEDFRSELSRNMQIWKCNSAMKHSREGFQTELHAIKGSEHFKRFKDVRAIHYNTNAQEILQDFNAYTTMEAQTFKETIIQNMDSIAQYTRDARQKGSKHLLQVQEMKHAVGCIRRINDKEGDGSTLLLSVQNNDENNVFANERQHSEKNSAECTDERAALANLIANLTLDTEENKMILKQLKKANGNIYSRN
ncbi:hypothetical protein Tco_0577933 [Tanacetum coccineum]